MQFLSLKIYWEKERQHIKNKEQEIYNCWIDQILLPQSGLYYKANDGSIHIDDCKKAIEFADYLYVSIDNKNNVNAFACCIDHPCLNYDIWNKKDMFEPQGSFEISLICSKLRGEGAKLIHEIKNFASLTLFRKNIQLIVNKQNQKLIEYYTKLQFKTYKTMPQHLRMICIL